MPMTMDEYEYLRETIEQVCGLAELTRQQMQAEDQAPQPYNVLSTSLPAIGRAYDDAIAVPEGMTEVP